MTTMNAVDRAAADRAAHRYRWLVGLPSTPAGWTKLLVAMLLGLWALQWSATGAQLSPTELANGLPQIADFLSRTWPPDWRILDRLWAPALETIQIAVWGTLLGAVAAVPVSFLAARNLQGPRWLYRLTRQGLNVTRSINELILALVFVSAVGLGPFPGVLELSHHVDG